MLGEFLLRLAVALPLVCLMAAGGLWVLKRVAPGFTLGSARKDGAPKAGMFRKQLPAHAKWVSILATHRLSPSVSLAVVQFENRNLLLSVGPQGATLVSEGAAVTEATTPTEIAVQLEPAP